MRTLTRSMRVLAIAIAGALFLAPAHAAVYNWTGASGTDLLWPTPGNWTAGGPTGLADSAVFDDTGSTNSAGMFAADNVVPADVTIQSLAYNQTNGFHNTVINSGVTLTLSSTAGAYVLLAGTETDNGSTQRETNTISGPGRLVLDNANAALVVRQGGGTANGAKSVLDLSGLDTFVARVGRVLVGVANPSGFPNINRNTGLLYLARTNQITASSATAPAIDIGKSSSNNGGGSTVYLGQTNAIFADTMAVAREKETACLLAFNPALFDSSAYFRGADGTSRVSLISIGDGVANSGTTTCRGTIDLSGGAIDGRVDTLVLGRAATAGTGANTSTGTLTFDRGTMDVNTLQVGLQTSANTKSGNGTVNVNGTATLVVNGALELGHTTGGTGAAATTGTLAMNGGTVIANVITNAGGGTTTITMTGARLVVTNFAGSVGTTVSPIGTLNIGDSALTLAASAGTPAVVAGLINVTSSTNNTIHIAKLPLVTTYPAQFPLVQSPALGFVDFVLGALPPAVPPFQGYLSNNVINNSVDLVLTNGPQGAAYFQWTGAAGADWDTTSLNWLSGGSPAVYHDGAPVQFDDSATGPTLINLTGPLAPGDVVVSNNAKIYTFSGPGRLTAATGLTKANTGLLILDNTGVNDFAGSISIKAGTLQVGNNDASGNLPPSSISDEGILAFARTDNLSVANTVSGSGALEQNGPGALSLTGPSSYTGATIVNGGTLLLNNTLTGGGMLTNAPGTVIGGNGTNNGPVLASGVINPGNGSTAGTFGSGPLTLEAGGGLAFDLNPADATAGAGINDLLQVNGDLTAVNNTVSVNFLGLPALGLAYQIIGYSGSMVGTLNPVVGGTHYTATLDATQPNAVFVTFTGSGANLKWNSTSSGVWDNATANWVNLATTLPDRFYSGDTVLFDDSVAGVETNVTIGPGMVIAPATLTNISSANSFTIAGAGKISGAGSIVKGGASTLALNTTNDTFTGTVDVAAGTLRVGSGLALGTAAGGTSIENGGTLDVNGQNLGSEPVVVSGAGADGLGAIINSGAQQVNALKAVTLAGHTTFGGTGRWDIRGGPASLSTGGQPFNITKKGTNQVSLVAVAPIDAALADIDIQEGSFAIQTSTAQVGDPNRRITVHTNAVLNLWNLTAANLNKLVTLRDGATLYSENGHSTIDGSITLENGTGTVNVNNGGTTPALIVNGSISGSGGLLKIGGAPLTLVGANNYAGATTVSNGTLYVEGSLGGSGVSVYGGTLAGIGTVSTPVTVYPDGILSPAGAQTNGTLTIAGPLKLQGTVILDVNKTADVFTGDSISGVTTLTLGGTLQLNLTGDALAAGDVIPLFAFTSASGAFAAIAPASPGAGLVWDTHTLAADGKLRVAVFSNPPAIGNISLSGSTVSISGSGGPPGNMYYVLSSTNVALPLANWTPVATNQFDGAGNFSFTQPVDQGVPSRFYRLQLP